MKTLLLPLPLLLALFAPIMAAEPTAVDQLEAAKQDLAKQNYLLQYKLKTGDEVRTKVVHIATTETKIRGTTQKSQSRSVSTKVWKVTDVDEQGNMTFTHSVSDVEMWQKVSDRPEVKFNSKKDKEAPPEYRAVAKTVGIPSRK